MAGTVGQHQQSTFTNPQNGQSPVDANQVTANDNATRVTYNTHDADPTIHVQSFPQASLPAAGTAQRVLVTTDTLRILIDTGSVLEELDYLNLTLGGTVFGNVTFSGTLTGTLTGSAATLTTARTIALGGVLSGSASFDGSSDITITASYAAGSIVDANVNASAAIALTKLAGWPANASGFLQNNGSGSLSWASPGGTISGLTTGKLSKAASSTTLTDSLVSESGSTVTVTGTLAVTGTTLAIRGVTYTFPSAHGTAGQVLSDPAGNGTLAWAAPSAGFITGSGTTNSLTKFTGSSAVGNSLLSDDGTDITLNSGALILPSATAGGLQAATTGDIRLSNGTVIKARNWSNTADLTVLLTDSSDYVQLGIASSAAKVKVGFLGASTILGGLTWPTADGSANQVLQTNGSGVLSWVTQAGGVSGSGTTNTIALFSGSTAVGNSLLTQSGSVVTMTGGFTVTGTALLNGNVTLGSSGANTISLNGLFASPLVPNAANTYDLGSSGATWANLWLGGVLKVGGNQVVGARDTGYAPVWNSVYAANKSASLGPLGTPANLSQCAAAVDITALGQIVHAMYVTLFNHGLLGT